jgi:hypothetical protein
MKDNKQGIYAGIGAFVGGPILGGLGAIYGWAAGSDGGIKQYWEDHKWFRIMTYSAIIIQTVLICMAVGPMPAIGGLLNGYYCYSKGGRGFDLAVAYEIGFATSFITPGANASWYQGAAFGFVRGLTTNLATQFYMSARYDNYQFSARDMVISAGTGAALGAINTNVTKENMMSFYFFEGSFAYLYYTHDMMTNGDDRKKYERRTQGEYTVNPFTPVWGD